MLIKKIFSFAYLYIGITFLVSAQYTSTIPVESTIILPPDYHPATAYPVVVLLPFTGGDAEYMFNSYAYEAGSKSDNPTEKLGDILNVFNARRPDAPISFVVILPKGKGSRRDHSWRGFEQCYKRYEQRIKKDLAKFSESYNLDTGRVYLSGVSLGGDLSWALSLRDPDYYQGALVMGSRCSYIPPDGSLEKMHQKNFSFFMTMGMKEAYDRLNGIRYARKQLDSLQILNIYKEMPDLYHHKAPLWLFLEGIDYLFKAKDKIRENKMLTVDMMNKLSGNYKGDLEINHFDKSEEKSDLTMNGDGLFVPLKTEFEQEAELEIIQIASNKVKILLKHNELAAFEAYVTENVDWTQNIEFTIYEQAIGSLKFRGTSIGENDSKIHGVYSNSSENPYISISFDVYSSVNPEKFSTYTFFASIK
jgi:pimeloyl-ACP methyl ester carboxylesterase